MTGSDTHCGALTSSPEAQADLRAGLLAVLEDETGQRSLKPPTASELTQEEWDDLPEAERNPFRLAHLSSLDPRLLTNTVLNPAGPFRRPSRHRSRWAASRAPPDEIRSVGPR